MWAFITGMSWCLAGFSSVKLLCARPPPLPLPTLYFWEGNHYAALIPKEGEVMFCLFEGGVFPVIIWNSAWEIGLVSPIIYAIIYLYQYHLMAIHFILLCYNPVLLSFLLRVFQLWQLRVLSFGPCVPLTYSSHGVCLPSWALPYFFTIRCSRLILYVSFPSPRNCCFPKNPLLLELEEWYWKLRSGC